MTPFELARIAAEPFLPYLTAKVRGELRAVVRPGDRILDVGGRNSPYTIGLPARVTIMDLPREREVQAQLGLGLTNDLVTSLRRRRSNIEDVLIEDMTRTTLPSASFDGVVSIEVIEHVPDDRAFVAQIARVLRPGGWMYLTTPNGDYIKNEPPNHNPDHIRHYRRAELGALLSTHVSSVRVYYGISTGRHRAIGLHSLDPRRPLRAARTMWANVRSRLESQGLEDRSRRTAHLFALARV